MKKKSKKSNLEIKRGIFFQLGLIISLAVVLMAFEWTSGIDNSDLKNYISDKVEIYEEMVPITQQEKPIPPPPKMKAVIDEIKVVDDNIVIDDVVDIPIYDINDTIDLIPYIALTEEKLEPIPYFKVEKKPFFGDGKDATLINYIASNTHYPDICVKTNVKGTVWISFVINEKGEVVNVELLRGIDSRLDEEAIKTIKNMPKWTPGIQAGRKVPVPYQLPVKFVLY